MNKFLKRGGEGVWKMMKILIGLVVIGAIYILVSIYRNRKDKGLPDIEDIEP